MNIVNGAIRFEVSCTNQSGKIYDFITVTSWLTTKCVVEWQSIPYLYRFIWRRCIILHNHWSMLHCVNVKSTTRIFFPHVIFKMRSRLISSSYLFFFFCTCSLKWTCHSEYNWTKIHTSVDHIFTNQCLFVFLLFSHR